MNIYQKLIEVRKAVPYLKKENEGYQFKFVSSSQTLSALKEKMDDMQLLLVPSITSKNLIEKSTIGAKEHLTEIEMDFVWINAEKPEEVIKCHWYGQGLDTGEKGVGKALTYAEKYFLLKFFNIPTDKDDPDGFQNKAENSKTIPKTIITDKSGNNGNGSNLEELLGLAFDSEKTRKAFVDSFKGGEEKMIEVLKTRINKEAGLSE